MATETRYESTFIVKGSLEEDVQQALVAKVEDTIKKNGGTIIEMESWGRRKLAYPIEKETYGLYVSAQFRSTGATIAKLERLYQLDESIMRWLTLVMPDANYQKRGAMKKRVEDVAARRTLDAANAAAQEEEAAKVRVPRPMRDVAIED